MNLKEKQKRLEMALTEHKSLLIDTGDNQKFKLKWDESINEYRGTSMQNGAQIGIWDLEFLINIASEKVNGASLEVAYE